MRKLIFPLSVVFVLFANCLIAQPFLQLVPQGLYKADIKLAASDWAGFYYTSPYDPIGKAIMLLLPAGGDSIAGFCASEDGSYVRILKGKMEGNGIKYTYETIFFGKDKPVKEPKGNGFMVMKDDGKKENVYCKHGDSKGMKEVEGCFTAGRIKPVELIDKLKPTANDWALLWKKDEKEKWCYNLENFYDGYISVYTVKYQKSDTKYGNYVNTVRTTTYPKSAILTMGMLYGDCFYYIYTHKDASKVGAGVSMMSPDKQSFKGDYVEKKDLKKLDVVGKKK